MRHVIFKLNDSCFGLPVNYVREILRSPEIHRLPQSPDFIDGVINVRQYHVAVMNLRKCLGFPPRNGDCRVIMAVWERKVIGLIVDEVSEILEIDSSEIEAMRRIGPGYLDTKSIQGICLKGEREIFLLSIENLLKERLAGV